MIATSSRPPLSFDAVVFDLDGTLVDSAPDLAIALNRLLAQEGYPEITLEEVKWYFGAGLVKMIGDAFTANGETVTGERMEDLCRRYMAYYEKHRTDFTQPYAGVTDTLAWLAGSGVALGICTNRPLAASMDILKALDLADFFHTVLGGDSLDGVRKPDPRHLLAVTDGLGVAAGRTVMVGDTDADAGAAHAAGVPFVAVSFGYAKVPVAELDARAVIDSYSELPEALVSAVRQN